MQAVAPNLWIKHYPFSMLGGRQGRVVTIIRLASGKLIIHSTAPFTPQDVGEIETLGTPIWLVDVMNHHDTFARSGRGAFPRCLYLAPNGLSVAGVDPQPLLPIPSEWEPELRVLLIDGMPAAQEHVFLHIASRTLIVADLVFNFEPAPGWTGFFRRALMGVRESPDCARLYPLLVRDRAAYDQSIRELFSWNFDRIIVGHHQPVETNGRELLRQALARKKMLPAKL
jgi:hypothetical protein